MAPVNEKFANDIKAATWPPDAQDEADALSAAAAGDAGVLYSCAKATTDSGAQATLAGHNFQTAADAASAMRLALGLPIDR
jgi:hypothetical protein